ncbi:MAG: alkaline phosphatase [Peptoniphilus sp.]|nr:alkaline phosphatase [Peptoniphilus sp.]
MRNIKKIGAIALAVATLLPNFAFAAKKDYGTAKNVILMIPDGMNVESVTTARWLSNDFELAFDFMATGLVKTNNSNTPIADSAPAGTAMATGVKTQSPYIATRPEKGGMPGAEDFDENKKNYPLATVLEGAERKGKSTGIISTSNIQHATPADFSSHHPNRNNYEDLGEQQIYQGMEVVLGAGSKYLEGDRRADGEDLIAEIKNLGYEYVTNTAAMKAAQGDKLFGLFAPGSLNYSMDRDPEVEPSLAEMTDKALDVLSKNEKGFFLMVEGSQIDWAAHANDPVGIKSEVLAFDEAVKVAVDFANANKDTVIIVASDHGTGGMTFGNNNISSGYDKAPLESFTKLIHAAKLTGQGFAQKLNEDKSNIAELFKETYGFDLTAEEVQSIKDAKDIQMAVGHIISDKSNIGWTTGGHVGGDVGLYCYSTAKDAKLLTGTVHNKDIGQYIEALLGLDLAALSEELYQPARPGFEAKGAKVEFKYESEANPVIVVTKGDQEITFPISKNYAIQGDEKVEIGGLTLFNGTNVFVPKAAFELIK